MIFTLPVDLPDTVLRVARLRAGLAQLPDQAMVVADVHSADEGPRRILLGWPVQASVRDETGRRVLVVALPQESESDAAVDVSLLRSRLAGLPDHALVVAIWETPDGPRQTTIGWPTATVVKDETTGRTTMLAALPQEDSGATSYAYDEIVANLGWE